MHHTFKFLGRVRPKLYKIYILVIKISFAGSHCLDILQADETDPHWLVKQRRTEVEIIEGWIATYYADLATVFRK